jgi:hypothetical protein
MMMMKPFGSDRTTVHEEYSLKLRALIEILFGDQLQSFSAELTDCGLVLRGFCDSLRVKWMVEKAIMQIAVQRIAANDLVVKQPQASNR